MKIRSDFVTNSSSSCFVTIHVESEKLAKYFQEHMNEIKEASDAFKDWTGEPWNPVEVKIKGANVEISSGDRDASFEYPPSCLDEVTDCLLGIVGLCYDGNEHELRDSIEKINWESFRLGLNGDDGGFEQDNYDPDVLQSVLEEIAECNDCTPDEVTNEMFLEYVAVEPDTMTEEATFEFSKKTGKSKYYYATRTHITKIETDEYDDEAKKSKQKALEWMDGKIFVLTGFDDRTRAKYESLIYRAGGTVKSSTVLKTNYLIYDPDYGYETAKLKRAKELNQQGKNITIITGKEFEAMLS